jgi:ADP-ribose diphosphatase
MSEGDVAAGEALADRAAEVVLSPPELIGRGFRNYLRHRATVAGDDGPVELTRDVLRVGKVAAVLPLDLARDQIVLIRQFRLPAHLANGRGELVELVAGHVEQGETNLDAARRECIEEIGVAPDRLIELLAYLPTPGLCDEEITVYLGLIDAGKVPARAGAAAEHEFTRPFAVPVDAVLAALERGTFRSSPLVVALQWLALHRNRLHDLVRTDTTRR